MEELREIDSHTLVKATAKINGPLGKYTEYSNHLKKTRIQVHSVAPCFLVLNVPIFGGREGRMGIGEHLPNLYLLQKYF